MKKLLFLALCISVFPALGAETAAGVVVLANGEAWLERGGERREMAVGLEVYPADVLITGKRGRLKVLFSDDSLLSLASKSRVMVTRHIFDAEQNRRSTLVELTAGKLRALVQKVVAGRQADFQVRASTAVAGVRGTEFVVAYEDNQVQLFTLSGEVTLATEGAEPVLVAAGQKSRLEAGRPSMAEAVAAAEVENLRRETEGEYQPQAVAMVVMPASAEALGEGEEGGASTSESDRHPNRQQALFVNGNPNGNYGVWRQEEAGDNRFAGSYNSEADITGEVNINGKWENPDTIPPPYVKEIKVRINLKRN